MVSTIRELEREVEQLRIVIQMQKRELDLKNMQIENLEEENEELKDFTESKSYIIIKKQNLIDELRGKYDFLDNFTNVQADRINELEEANEALYHENIKLQGTNTHKDAMFECFKAEKKMLITAQEELAREIDQLHEENMLLRTTQEVARGILEWTI